MKLAPGKMNRPAALPVTGQGGCFCWWSLKRIALFYTLLSLALLCAVPLCAEVYTYTDGKGAVSYVDDLGKVPAKYRSKVKLLGEMEPLNLIDSGGPTPAKNGKVKRPSAKAAEAGKRFDGTIELYVTSWCPACKSAESYIKKMGYQSVQYDIEKDAAARSRSNSYPGRGVPLIVVGDNSFRGFSSEMLEYYLSK